MNNELKKDSFFLQIDKYNDVFFLTEIPKLIDDYSKCIDILSEIASIDFQEATLKQQLNPHLIQLKQHGRIGEYFYNKIYDYIKNNEGGYWINKVRSIQNYINAIFYKRFVKNKEKRQDFFNNILQKTKGLLHYIQESSIEGLLQDKYFLDIDDFYVTYWHPLDNPLDIIKFYKKNNTLQQKAYEYFVEPIYKIWYEEYLNNKKYGKLCKSYKSQIQGDYFFQLITTIIYSYVIYKYLVNLSKFNINYLVDNKISIQEIHISADLSSYTFANILFTKLKYEDQKLSIVQYGKILNALVKLLNAFSISDDDIIKILSDIYPSISSVENLIQIFDYMQDIALLDDTVIKYLQLYYSIYNHTFDRHNLIDKNIYLIWVIQTLNFIVTSNKKSVYLSIFKGKKIENLTIARKSLATLFAYFMNEFYGISFIGSWPVEKYISAILKQLSATFIKQYIIQNLDKFIQIFGKTTLTQHWVSVVLYTLLGYKSNISIINSIIKKRISSSKTLNIGVHEKDIISSTLPLYYSIESFLEHYDYSDFLETKFIYDLWMYVYSFLQSSNNSFTEQDLINFIDIYITHKKIYHTLPSNTYVPFVIIAVAGASNLLSYLYQHMTYLFNLSKRDDYATAYFILPLYALYKTYNDFPYKETIPLILENMSPENRSIFLTVCLHRFEFSFEDSVVMKSYTLQTLKDIFEEDFFKIKEIYQKEGSSWLSYFTLNQKKQNYIQEKTEQILWVEALIQYPLILSHLIWNKDLLHIFINTVTDHLNALSIEDLTARQKASLENMFFNIFAHMESPMFQRFLYLLHNYPNFRIALINFVTKDILKIPSTILEQQILWKYVFLYPNIFSDIILPIFNKKDKEEKGTENYTFLDFLVNFFKYTINISLQDKKKIMQLLIDFLTKQSEIISSNVEITGNIILPYYYMLQNVFYNEDTSFLSEWTELLYKYLAAVSSYTNIKWECDIEKVLQKGYLSTISNNFINFIRSSSQSDIVKTFPQVICELYNLCTGQQCELCENNIDDVIQRYVGDVYNANNPPPYSLFPVVVILLSGGKYSYDRENNQLIKLNVSEQEEENNNNEEYEEE